LGVAIKGSFMARFYLTNAAGIVGIAASLCLGAPAAAGPCGTEQLMLLALGSPKAKGGIDVSMSTQSCETPITLESNSTARFTWKLRGANPPEFQILLVGPETIPLVSGTNYTIAKGGQYAIRIERPSISSNMRYSKLAFELVMEFNY